MGVNSGCINTLDMQKQINLFCVALLFLVCGARAAQVPDTINVPKNFKVAIFAPLYLDSAFNASGSYRYGKTFPKFTLQGLDFVQGAMIALDSMPLPNVTFNTHIYDSKSVFEGVETLISAKMLDSMDLIIGSVKDKEYAQLAAFARLKNIPFVSATYPNDGGITDNPFTVIVTPTLKAHCEAIYAMLLQNHSADKIVVVRRPGAQENTVEQLFRKINEPDGKPLLRIEFVNIQNDDFSILKNRLDSNRKNVLIGGSLNESFAGSIATYAQSIESGYETMLIGMPNWDGFNSIRKNKKLKDYPVYYTSPFYNNKWDSYSKKIKEAYLKKYKGIPSDLTYKGFETTLQFAKLLSKYPNDLTSHLNDYPYKIFSDFKFKPVFLKKENSIPDYFENKHLYFIKILNGKDSKVW